MYDRFQLSRTVKDPFFSPALLYDALLSRFSGRFYLDAGGTHSLRCWCYLLIS